ncbi:MAG TPA: helix-turn-helix transcriptional regulator [Candidatus Nanoarchaeia archaeon]|nr:helix-turn-helix transcriptional regulator [Candidatus Nanoarchaeia archaeon]
MTLHPSCNSFIILPPGKDTILEILAERQYTISDLANRLGISNTHLGNILNGRKRCVIDVSHAMYRKLSKDERLKFLSGKAY